MVRLQWYSNVPNKRACTFISGKVCLLTLIEPKRQTLPEINVHARLFGTLEYSEKVTSILINLKKQCCMLLICNPCSNLPFTGPVAFLSSKYGKRAFKGLKTYSCSQNSTVLKGSMIKRKIFNTRFDYRIWYLVSGETNKTCDFKSSKL